METYMASYKDRIKAFHLLICFLTTIVLTGCIRSDQLPSESSIKADQTNPGLVDYQSKFPEMPLRVYCGKAEENFKPVILLERYIRSLEDPFYKSRNRILKSSYRLFRIESAVDIEMGVSKIKSDYKDGWSFWLDDIEAHYNWTPGHEGISFKQSGEAMPIFLWFSLNEYPQRPFYAKSLARSESTHNLLAGLFGSSEKDIEIQCKPEKLVFAPQAPAIDDVLTLELVQKNRSIRRVSMFVDLLSHRQIRNDTGKNLFAGDVASGFILKRKGECEPNDIDMNKIVGSHVFDKQGFFVGQVLEYREGDGSNILIQLVNDNGYGRFYAKGQTDAGWSPQPPKFPVGTTFLMSETFKKYKEYISSDDYKQKYNNLKSAETKGGPSAQIFKERTQIKMLSISRQP